MGIKWRTKLIKVNLPICESSLAFHPWSLVETCQSLWNRCPCVCSRCSTSAIIYVHWALACLIRPHLVQTLWTRLYMHWIHTLSPLLRRNMNPAMSGIHGSILTQIRMKQMFLGMVKSQSILSYMPRIRPICMASSGYWYSKDNPCSWTQSET